MAWATITLHGDLTDFLPRRRRSTAIRRRFDGRPAAKDLLEALGVPHPEVAAITVNGAPAGFDQRLQDGDRVEVWGAAEAAGSGLIPVLPAAPEDSADPRFVVDGHLGRLAAYLRMLGFDTSYGNDADDARLAAIAATERRILLTRDRGLLKRSVVRRGAFLRSDQPVEQLVEVARRFGLVERWRPFGRCIRCNALLVPVSRAEALPRLQPLTQDLLRRLPPLPGVRRHLLGGIPPRPDGAPDRRGTGHRLSADRARLGGPTAREPPPTVTRRLGLASSPAIMESSILMEQSRRPHRFAARLSRLLVVAGMALLLGTALDGPSSTNAADPSPTPAPAGDPTAPVYVVSATGVVDNVMAGYIEESVKRAADTSSPAIIVTINTPGGSLDATQRIVSSLLEAPLPTIVWVAPSGGRAASAGTFITLSANLAYMAPGTNIGAASPVGSGGEELEGTIGEKVRNDAIANIRSIAEARGRDVDWAVSTVRDAVSSPASEAVAIGAVDGIATSLEDVRRQARRPGRGGRCPAGHRGHRRRPVRRPADEPVPVDHPPAVGPERRIHPPDTRLLRAALRAPEPQLRDRHPGCHRAHPRVHRVRQPAAQRRRSPADRAGDRAVRARVHRHEPRPARRRRPHLLRAGRVRAVHATRHADRSRRHGGGATRLPHGGRHGGVPGPRARDGRSGPAADSCLRRRLRSRRHEHGADRQRRHGQDVARPRRRRLRRRGGVDGAGPDSGAEIPTGEHVRVVGQEGLTLIVEPGLPDGSLEERGP